MRVLYVPYATWKAVAVANVFAVYDKLVVADTYKAWAGGLDLVYMTDVEPADAADYTTTFPTRTSVEGEDEAIANIVGLGGAQSRSADGTPVFGRQRLDLSRLSLKRTDNGTESMKVDGRAAGAQLIVWNGTGAGDTGGDWSIGAGSSGSETAGSAHSGTNGWDSGARSANDYTSFDNGSEIAVAGVYDTLSFWMQVKNFPGNGSLQIQWRNGVSTVIGNTLLIPNYVTNMDLNVWQKVTIPIADFGLTGNVQRLRIVYKTGNNQQEWFDDIQLQASGGGGPYTFRAQSPTGFVYHVERLVIVVSAPNTGWSSSAFANIAGGLENGVLLKYHNIGVNPQTFWTFNAKTNAEFFGQFGTWNSVVFDGGEQLIAFSLDPDLSSVILVDDDDVLDIVIRDNLSGLSNMRAFLHIGTEKVQ